MSKIKSLNPTKKHSVKKTLVRTGIVCAVLAAAGTALTVKATKDLEVKAAA